MKRKHIIIGLIILLGMLFLFAACANADWEKDGDHLIYTECGIALTGQQTIKGKEYTFTDEGYLMGTGEILEIAGFHYYIDSSNRLLYGWQTLGGNKYYFDQATGRALSYGDCYSWNSEYNGDRTGDCYASWKINGSWYVFNGSGSLVINDWYLGYYGNKEGKILTGYQKVEDSYYYFNEYGKCQEGFVTINNYIHYFHEHYAMASEARGWNRINSNWYYFDDSNGIMRTGSWTVRGHKYLLNNDGTLKINGNTVLYDAEYITGIDSNGDYLDSCWQVIDGNTYYFDALGHALTGVSGTTEGCYYFAEDGIRRSDVLVKEKGYYYYFGADGKAVTGWKKINGYTYYFSDTGYRYRAYTGLHSILKNGKYYKFYFDKTGKMQTNKWLTTDKNIIYYFGADGKAVTGWKTISGNTYYFDADGCAIIGLAWLNAKGGSYYFYFDQKGRMQSKKLVTISKNDNDQHDAKVGDIFYLGEDGKAIEGWKTIKGYTYYFNPPALRNTTKRLENDEEEVHKYTFDSEGRLIAIDGQDTISIGKAKISVKNQVYTGQAIKPDLTVKVKGKKLKLKKDYTVKWQNNTEIGEATVTLTGKGIYYGTTTATFKIIPQSVKLSSLKAGNKQLTVKWKKGSNIEGYVIEYSLKKNFSNAKKVIIPKAKTNTTKIKKLKNGKTYYVRIRTFKEVGGKNYYSKWSNVLSEEVGK